MNRITLPLGDDMIAEIDKRLKPNETRVGYIRDAILFAFDHRDSGSIREAAE